MKLTNDMYNSLSTTTLLSLCAVPGVLVGAGAAEASTSPDPQEIELFRTRTNIALKEEFELQNETYGAWIGLSDPDYGDLFFVYGNHPDDHDDGSYYYNLEDRFDIGSISKTMGGTAILLLVDRGDLALTDTVAALLPEFSQQFPEYANNTVEQLLRMQTLVPDFLNDPEGEGILQDQATDLSKRYTTDEIVAHALQKYPVSKATYSSTNIVVLELIAEAVTGQTPQELLQELIVEPLGFSNTSMPERSASGEHPKGTATPYAGPWCQYELVTSGFPNVTLFEDLTELSKCIVMAGYAGAVNSNIYDLLAWAKTGTGDSLLSTALLERRHQYNTDLGDIWYGMTQYIQSDEQVAMDPFWKGWAGHNGDAFGYLTMAWHNEVLNASFAFGANTCGLVALGDTALRIFTEDIQARHGSTVAADGGNGAGADDGTTVEESTDPGSQATGEAETEVDTPDPLSSTERSGSAARVVLMLPSLSVVAAVWFFTTAGLL